jgi:MerR family transcriptional regulator, redox-sensitive transcriptional activator SoxR
MADLSIGEVARQAGLRPSAIRYYEKIGLLPKPPRAGGRRRYDPAILDRLAMVRFAKQVGFRVPEIKILLGGSVGRPPPERWRALAHAKISDVDRLIAQASNVRNLLLATLDQKCPKLVERGRALSDAAGAPVFPALHRKA